MTHKKKSVSSALLRSAALVITPVIAAWVLPALHSRSVKADAEPVSFRQAEYNVSDSGIKSFLNEGLILS